MAEKGKEKRKGKEKGVETEKVTEEAMMGEDDWDMDGDGEEEASSAPIT